MSSLFLHWNAQVSHVTTVMETILCAQSFAHSEALSSWGMATHHTYLEKGSSHTAEMFHQRAILPDPQAIYRYFHFGLLWPAINFKTVSKLSAGCMCLLSMNSLCVVSVLEGQAETLTSPLLIMVFSPCIPLSLPQFLGEVRPFQQRQCVCLNFRMSSQIPLGTAQASGSCLQVLTLMLVSVTSQPSSFIYIFELQFHHL